MDITNLLIKKDTSVNECIKILDEYGKKIIIVLDQNKLIGVITDGDIRRFILKNGDLNSNVTNIMNKSPKYLNISEKEKAFDLMETFKIDAVPVVNDNHEVIDIIFSGNILKTCNVNALNTTPIVIMAGGRGERLHPFTKIIPKMLIPIGEIPITERIISKFQSFNFNNFYISINYKKDMIKAYFNENANYNITFVEETLPLGTAGSLNLLKNMIKETFFVTNCDILIEANYSDILKFHKKSKNKITVVTALKNYPVPYGIFNLNESGKVCSLEEKPNYQFLINTGMYILEPEVIDLIDENTFCDMTDLIYKYIEKNNDSVGIYPITENSWLDMGEFSALKNMNEKLNF